MLSIDIYVKQSLKKRFAIVLDQFDSVLWPEILKGGEGSTEVKMDLFLLETVWV